MKIENTNYAATIQCARQHFSYCAAAHPRSLEGTLINHFDLSCMGGPSSTTASVSLRITFFLHVRCKA